MRYFIDFEATQYSEEIISIGCVREDGETFYSLVLPAEGKLTPFITNLTGITEEKLLSDALSSDNAFELFYDWAFSEEDTPIFYSWGSSDMQFLRNTFKRTNSHKARMAIGYVCASLKDYSKKFCKKIKTENCSLLNAFKGLVDSNATQNHNSLDDAYMLWRVHCKMHDISLTIDDIREKMSGYIFNNKKENSEDEEKKVKWSKRNLTSGSICIIDKKGKALSIFSDLDEATAWIIENRIGKKNRENTKFENVSKNIKKAYSNGTTYFNMNWRIVP